MTYYGLLSLALYWFSRQGKVGNFSTRILLIFGEELSNGIIKKTWLIKDFSLHNCLRVEILNYHEKYWKIINLFVKKNAE